MSTLLIFLCLFGGVGLTVVGDTLRGTARLTLWAMGVLLCAIAIDLMQAGQV